MTHSFKSLFAQICLFYIGISQAFAHKTGLKHNHGNSNDGGDTPEIDGNELMLGFILLASIYLFYVYQKNLKKEGSESA